MFGLMFAGLNAVFQAFMVKFDQLMMGDCYEDRPKMAWLVSTIAGSILGIVTMFGVSVVYWFQTGDAITPSDVLYQWNDGVWMMAVGILTTIVMGCYFHLFKKSEAGDAPDVTTISMWLASTPIWVTAATWLIVTFDLRFGPLAGLEIGDVSPFFFLAILLTTFFIIRFDAEGKRVPLTLSRATVVGIMVISIATYTIIASSVVYGRELAELLALQPYYWAGFATGIFIFLSKSVRTEWTEFKLNKFHQYKKVIVLAEIFGAGVYIFEMYALWHLSGVLVNLISSGHVIIVFLLGFVLTYIGNWMIRRKKPFQWGTVVLEGKSLVTEPATRIQWFLFGAVVTGMAVAILIAGQ